MSSTEPKLATYADLKALPADVRGEVLAGEIMTAPAPLPQRPDLSGWRRVRLARPGLAWPIDDTSVARIAPFEAIELEVGRLFLPHEADEAGVGER